MTLETDLIAALNRVKSGSEAAFGSLLKLRSEMDVQLVLSNQIYQSTLTSTLKAEANANAVLLAFGGTIPSAPAPSPSPSPAPAPSTSPTVSSLVADQNNTFTLTQTTAIKYGVQSRNLFYQRTLQPGTYNCSDDFFGDPAYGFAKSCYLVGTDASSPPQSPTAGGTLPTTGYVPTGVVFEGDSITQGGGDNTSPYPAQYATLTGIPVINVGLQGQTMQQMRAGYSLDGGPGPVYTANMYNTLVLNGGTNDYALDNQTEIALRGYVQEEVTKGRASGYKVFVSTITPRAISSSWDSARESRRVSFNTWMRANWASFADGFIDFDAALSVSDMYDGIHPSNQGAAKMAGIVKLAFASSSLTSPVTTTPSPAPPAPAPATPTATTLALLHMTEIIDGQTPTTVVNSASGQQNYSVKGNPVGVTYSEYDTTSPYYKMLYSGNDPIVIYSNDKYTFTGAFCIEFFSRNDVTVDNVMLELADGDGWNGTATSALGLFAQSNGAYDSATGLTPAVAQVYSRIVGAGAVTAIGSSSGYTLTRSAPNNIAHHALCRDASNIIRYYRNGQLMVTTPSTPGTYTGYLNIGGSRNSGSNTITSALFQTGISELRVVSGSSVYTGTSFTPPTTRLTVQGTASPSPSPAPAPAPSTGTPAMANPVFVNGTLNATAYAQTASLMGTEGGADYLFGPASSYYGVTDSSVPLLYRNPDGNLDVIAAGYQNNDAVYGRNKLRGCNLGNCGTWQVGGPPLPGQGGMYSSSMGQGLFIPDNRQATPFGIGLTDFLAFSVSENIVSTKPELYYGYYGGGKDTINQVRYKQQGKDVSYPVAMARGEGRPGWGIGTISVTRGGFVSTSGQNTGSNIASLQLDANKRPTAVAVTNAHEFALITVWDTVALKGQIAVIALAGTPQDGYLGNEANWGSYRGEWRGVYPGLPNYGNIAFMKLVGYVDLPGMQTPSAISASTAWNPGFYAPFQDGFNLSDANTRTRLRSGDRSIYTPRQGIAVVISKEEQKAIFVDLGPLFRNYFDVWYSANTPPSVATGTFPPTFTQTPSQTPTIIKTVTFTDRPTAVKCSLSNLNKRVYIGLQAGSVRIWDMGDYPTNATGTGNPATIVERGSVAVGRNPTCIAVVKRHAGDTKQPEYFGTKIYPGADFEREIIVCSRGDRMLQWIRLAANYNSGTIQRQMQDQRMVDPISVEDNDNHTTETYIVTVADYNGKQFVNYRYGPAIFWDHKGVMSDNPDNPLSYDWTACLPPNGAPVRSTTFNNTTYQFECGGTYAMPGKPVSTSTANVY